MRVEIWLDDPPATVRMDKVLLPARKGLRFVTTLRADKPGAHLGEDSFRR